MFSVAYRNSQSIPRTWHASIKQVTLTGKVEKIDFLPTNPGSRARQDKANELPQRESGRGTSGIGSPTLITLNFQRNCRLSLPLRSGRAACTRSSFTTADRWKTAQFQESLETLQLQ